MSLMFIVTGIFLVLTLLLALGLVFMLRKPEVSLGRVVVSLLSVLIIGFAGFILLVISAFIGKSAAFYSPFVLVVTLYLVVIAILFGFKVLYGKRLVAMLLIGTLAAGIAVGVYEVKSYMDERVLTVSENNLLYDYEPFSDDNKLAKLPGTATLKMAENLPVMDGATALYPVYAAFAEAVYPSGKYGRFDSAVRCTTTTGAYESLIAGEVDMIIAAAPSEEQREAAEQAGKSLTLTPIGKEAFVFYVHQKNPVDGLTVNEIKGIYSGEITDWSALGGKRSQIRAFQRDEGSGSQTALERLMEGKPIMPPRTEDRYDAMMGIIKATADYRNYPNALGYSFRYYVTSMVGADELKLLEVNGVAPTFLNIQNGTYPIASEFYVVTAGTKNPNVKPFIDWILSPEGQTLVEKTGYVPVGETLE